MKILYIHQYFATPRGHGGNRSYEFARRWVAAGHQVTILTTNSYDSSLPRRGTAVIDGITVRSLGGVYRNQMGFITRVSAFIRFAVHSAWLAARAGKFDLVLASSTPLTVAIPALSAKWLARRPLVFEVRDVWPEGAIQAGFLDNRGLIWLARKLEQTVYRHADRIVPLSTGMEEAISAKGVPRVKMTMLPNCADLQAFSPDDATRRNWRHETGAEGKFILLYAGALGLANDIPFLMQAIEHFKDHDEMQWWFVGGGRKFKDLEQMKTTRRIHNLILWGEQPREQVRKFMVAADVGIVSFINQPVYYQNSPNKFFDYSSCGLPSIFTRTTWLEPWLERYQSGFVCRSNSLAEFSQLIGQFRDHPRQREQAGKNARRMAEEQFSRDVIAEQYLTLLKNTINPENRQ